MRFHRTPRRCTAPRGRGTGHGRRDPWLFFHGTDGRAIHLHYRFPLSLRMVGRSFPPFTIRSPTCPISVVISTPPSSAAVSVPKRSGSGPRSSERRCPPQSLHARARLPLRPVRPRHERSAGAAQSNALSFRCALVTNFSHKPGARSPFSSISGCREPIQKLSKSW